MKANRYVLITGPRRSGKSHRALELARADGRPFGVLLPTDELTKAFAQQYPDVPCATILPKHPPVDWVNVIIDDAHLIDAACALGAMALTINKGGTLYVVADPPTDKRAAWLLGLGAAGFEVLCMHPTEADSPAANRFRELTKLISGDALVS